MRMKKLSRTLLAAGLCGALVFSGAAVNADAGEPGTTDEQTSYIAGEINSDRHINAVDALLALKFSVGSAALSDVQQKAADVDTNGTVDATDALMILQRGVRKMKTFPADNDNLNSLSERFIAELRATYARPESWVADYLSWLQPDGSWENINYEDKGIANWNSGTHLVRMLTIAASVEPERIAQDEELRSKLLKALDFWLEKDPQSMNWWYNEISVPDQMTNVLLLIQDFLSEEQYELCRQRMNRGVVTETQHTGWTATNLIWGLKTSIKFALLYDDADELLVATNHLNEVVTVGDDEGIQTDGTYFQHGRQIQTAHYGWSGITDLTDLCQKISGTPYQIDEERLDAIENYLLNGVRYMDYNGNWNFIALGRAFFRRGVQATGSATAVCNTVASIEGVKNRDEILAMAKNIEDKSGYPLGGKYFDVGEYYAQFGDGFYVCSRVSDKNISMGELTNSEGLLGYNLACGGVSCIMVDGTEYNDIAPVWDYARIPGVTTIQENDFMIRNQFEWPNAMGENTYSGGENTADGKAGLTYMDYNHNGITGVISRFFTEDGMIALGAGITGNSGRSTISTVNQCWLTTAVEQSADQSVVTQGNVTYLNLDPTTGWTAESGTKTGSWKRVSGELSADEVSGDVFSLYCSHGTMPSNATYAYAVLPNRSDIGVTAQSLDIEVLSNTADCQAVRAGTRVMIVFHNAGSITLPDGQVIAGEAQTSRIVEQIGG